MNFRSIQMKKSAVALAAMLVSLTAAAQSSVTVFGVLDAAARYTKSSGKTLKSLGSDGLSSSRLGFRGVEDLGGGLKAGFWIEAAVATDTGAQGDALRFWNRRSSVSLMGNFGELRLGRGKTSARLHLDDFDPFGTTGLGDVSRLYNGLGSNVDTLNRADNQINYVLPGNLGGFYGSIDLAAGEGSNVAASPSTSTSSGGKKMQGFRFGFKQGGLNLGLGYDSTTSALQQKFTMTVFGAAYDFGAAKLQLNLGETKHLDRKQSLTTIGLIVPIGQGQITAGYTDAKANAAAEALAGVGDAKLFALGYVYNLSKRTAVYTTYSQIENNGKGQFSVTNSPAVTAGQKSSGFDLGLRHSF